MMEMEYDDRTFALMTARARVVIGLVSTVLPGVVGRLMLGSGAREVKAALRMAGIRDIVLGVGAITSLKEQTQDAEWVGMGAVADAGDALALLLVPVPFPRRVLNALGAGGAAVSGYLVSRRLADARTSGPAVHAAS
jgi:hypothetical protein